MSEPFRVAGWRPARRLRFRFDGRALEGVEGDTLASALLANGVHLVGRSFKYHRPRGVLAADEAEPNALVELRTGARREPNTRATEISLADGLVAASQNRRGTLAFDLMAVNQWFAPFLKAGFYYKTFKGPGRAWERLWEPLIRHAAGLGRAARAPDPDGYEHAHLHCDVLVVGAGPAGLAAADAARRSGARVVLAERRPALGGGLTGESGDLDDWVAGVAAGFDGADARLLTRTTVAGYYDDDVLVAVEQVGDHLAVPAAHGPRQRLWVIRARAAVLATGALEQPLLFADNDRPGIMLSTAVRHYLHAHGVVPGRRVVVATSGDDGYRTALDLAAAGVEVPAVVDARTTPGPVAAKAERAGIEVVTGEVPLRALGKQRVRGLEVGPPGGERWRRLDADAVAVAGGFAPTLHLASQAGARPVFDDRLGAFVPGAPAQNERSAGAARGVFDLAGCLEDGRRAGIDAARAAGFQVSDLPALPAVAAREEAPSAPRHVPRDGATAFVDFQNDVTVADLRLAVQEGYGRTEHAKRYTTLGMATDQGKTAGLNGLAVLAEARGCGMDELAPTTFRPPYTPVAIGAFAGHERETDYQPIRRTAMHRAHQRLGAIFGETGHWLRPRCYPRGDESLMEAAAREAIAVRASVGVCDVSTLGKIEIRGPDARTLLNRVYVNAWSKLAVGKARYGLMLREDGIAFDDGTTSCLADDHFLMTTTTANAARVLEHLEFLHQTAWPELDVSVCSATEQWCAMALAGPRARDVLELVLDGADVSNAALPFMGVLEATAGGAPVRVFRISFSGELAFELACPWGYGEALWERVLRAGAGFDITPYGTEALSILRIEKGHPAGQEFDGRTTAADLGMARLVSAKKRCVGQTLAERAGLADPERPALVGLVPVDAGEQLRGGAHLVADPGDARTATDLGWTSSVHWSPHVGAWIALAFVAGGLERWHGERVWAVYPLKDEAVEVEVRAPCFVDPEGARLRG